VGYISESLVDEIMSAKKYFKSKRGEEELYEHYKTGNLTSLLRAFLHCSSPQSFGPKFEKFYIRKNGFRKIPSNLDRGDFYIEHTNQYYEHKFSFAKVDSKNKFNFVQIRPHQSIDGYVLEVFSEEHEEMFTFNVPKFAMSLLLDEFGGLAHGTKDAVKENNRKEYALRGRIGGPLWNKLLPFLVKRGN